MRVGITDVVGVVIVLVIVLVRKKHARFFR